jgi:hypothetical protein
MRNDSLSRVRCSGLHCRHGDAAADPGPLIPVPVLLLPASQTRDKDALGNPILAAVALTIRAAKALGIEFRTGLLVRADEVIE